MAAILTKEDVGTRDRSTWNAPQLPKNRGPRTAPDHQRVLSTQPWVEVVHSARELAKHLVPWERLAAQTAEPNPLFEPFMFLPALDRLTTKEEFDFVLVYRPDPAQKQKPGLLSGFFPLVRRRGYRRLPVRHLALWQHPLWSMSTPLLDADAETEALEQLFLWTKTTRNCPRLLDFTYVHGDGRFHQALMNVCAAQGHATFQAESFGRALLRRGVDAESYLNTAMSAGNRKELRRTRRRLADLGKLELRTLEPGGDVAWWVERFLALEAAGWKGQAGTALAADGRERAFFAEIAQAAHRRGRLMMLGLFLNDQPVALKCNFLAGAGSFAFKIAFDEAFAKYSPGVHLEMDNVQALHQRPEWQWMDSCAIPRHFMINRLWQERRTMQSLLISTGGFWNDLVVGALPLLRSLKRWGRRT